MGQFSRYYGLTPNELVDRLRQDTQPFVFSWRFWRWRWRPVTGRYCLIKKDYFILIDHRRSSHLLSILDSAAAPALRASFRAEGRGTRLQIKTLRLGLGFAGLLPLSLNVVAAVIGILAIVNGWTAGVANSVVIGVMLFLGVSIALVTTTRVSQASQLIEFLDRTMLGGASE